VNLPVVSGVDKGMDREMVDIVFVYYGHNSAFSHESSFLKLSQAFVVWCCAFSEDGQGRPASVGFYKSLSCTNLVDCFLSSELVNTSVHKNRLDHTGQEAHHRYVAHELSWHEWDISSKCHLEWESIHRSRMVQNIGGASSTLRDFKIAFVIFS